MTEKKDPKNIEGKLSISGSAITAYLSTTANYHKPVEYKNKEPVSQPDYSEMQGSHYWVN
jgi:hypothetical protein